MIDSISYVPLKKIDNPLGDIWHGLKSLELQYLSFGEAYFSFVNQGKIKGWKKHNKATLNLIVPLGEIHFYAGFSESNRREFIKSRKFILGEKKYYRLTVPPGLWLAFKGISKKNMLLNISDIPHNKNESINEELDFFNFNFND